MVNRLLLVLRNILIVSLALTIGLVLFEMTANVPAPVKVLLVGSVVLSHMYHGYTEKYYCLIHKMMEEKLITFFNSHFTPIARLMRVVGMSYYGEIMNKGSTFTSIILPWGSSLLKANKNSDKSQDLHKLFFL